MRLILAAGLLSMALAGAPALAHHCTVTPAHQDTALATADLPAEAGQYEGRYYVTADASGVTVWQESGQEPGLQTTNGSCTASKPNGGTVQKGYGTDKVFLKVGPDGASGEGLPA